MVLKYLLPNTNSSKMVLIVHYTIIVGILLLCFLTSAYGIFEVFFQNQSSVITSSSNTTAQPESLQSSALQKPSTVSEQNVDIIASSNRETREIRLEIGDHHGQAGIVSGHEVSDFGEECETNGKQCNYSKFLECIDGKCMCQNPYHNAFDEDLQQCVSLAGSGCGGNGPVCVKNSKCTFGSCQCAEGHSETSTKLCLLNRGRNCKPNECNGDQGLACIRGTCQCIDSLMVFQPFSNKCVNPQAEFDNFARNLVQRIVLGKISRTVSGAKSLVFLPVRLLVPGIG
jgi:hypothetical protein